MLKPRLQKIYDLINHDTDHVVDIGADHAFLSIELVKNHKAKQVSNIEINQQPLDNGFKNVSKHNLTEKIHFYLNDGLKNLSLTKPIDYICISGMGADNIINILENNSNNFPKYFLLQANTDCAKLRKFLYHNFYKIILEDLVYENGRYYEIIQAEIIDSKLNYTESDLYIGPFLKQKTTDEFKDYLLKKHEYLSSLPIALINFDLQSEYQTIKRFLNEKKWIN